VAPPEQKIRYQRFYAELARKVKKAREKAGYTQEEMTGLGGFTKNGWQKIESKKPITLTTLLRVVELLGIPMRKLVSGCDTYLIDGNSEEKTSKKSASRRSARPRKS
jgi:transcriptional regulator with XRE-family HTH domain